MKILFNDICKKTTTSIASLFPSVLYPPSNVGDTFLNRIYLSEFDEDTLTIDFGAAYPVNSAFIAYLNAAEFDIDFRDASNASVFSYLAVKNNRKITVVYTDAIYQVKYLVITASIVTSGLASWVEDDDGNHLIIRGVGCGESYLMPERIASSFSLSKVVGSDYAETKSGQFVKNSFESRRVRDWQFVGMTWDQIKIIEALIATLDFNNPTYFDHFDESLTYDDAMYMVITDAPTVQRAGNFYNFNLKLKEAR